jgi:hypothetical protein
MQAGLIAAVTEVYLQNFQARAGKRREVSAFQ